MGEVVALSRMPRPPELPPEGYRIVVFGPDGTALLEYPVASADGGPRPWWQSPPAAEWTAVLDTVRWAYRAMIRG